MKVSEQQLMVMYDALCGSLRTDDKLRTYKYIHAMREKVAIGFFNQQSAELVECDKDEKNAMP